MATATQQRLENLQNKLTTMFGVQIEITIRGERSFTFSFEGSNELILNRIIRYLSVASKVTESGYDKECDMSFIYSEA